MSIQDIDERQGVSTAQVEKCLANWRCWCIVEEWDLVDEEAQLSGLGAEECIQRIRIVLGRVESTTDTTGKGSSETWKQS